MRACFYFKIKKKKTNFISSTLWRSFSLLFLLCLSYLIILFMLGANSATSMSVYSQKHNSTNQLLRIAATMDLPLRVACKHMSKPKLVPKMLLYKYICDVVLLCKTRSGYGWAAERKGRTYVQSTELRRSIAVRWFLYFSTQTLNSLKIAREIMELTTKIWENEDKKCSFSFYLGEFIVNLFV